MNKHLLTTLAYIWTCALVASAGIVALGVPWDYALAHVIPACFIGSAASALISIGVEKWAQKMAQSLLPPSPACATVQGTEPP